MIAPRFLFAVLMLLVAGCAPQHVEVHLEPSFEQGAAVVSVYPPHLAQRVRIAEVDGKKMGGGLATVRVEPGRHRFSVRVSMGSEWSSAARYDYVALTATIVMAGQYYLEVSPVTKLLQIRDAQSGQVVGESRYRLLF